MLVVPEIGRNYFQREGVPQDTTLYQEPGCGYRIGQHPRNCCMFIHFGGRGIATPNKPGQSNGCKYNQSEYE